MATKYIDEHFSRLQIENLENAASESGYGGSVFSDIETVPQIKSESETPISQICMCENEDGLANLQHFPGCSARDMEQLGSLISSVSLESLTSGLASGSFSSNERLSVPRCETSASSLSPISCTDQNINKKNIGQHSVISFKTTKPETELAMKHAKRNCKSAPPKSNSKRSETIDTLKTKTRKNKCAQEQYDPKLEKSQTYLHGQGKTFSKASQYLSPARPGLQKLQISYTQTNMENNYTKIFMDLVKSAHKKNIIVDESVRSLERRLLVRRVNPLRATTYYDNKGLKDPFRSKKLKKTARTLIEKKNERKGRIEKSSDEIRTGYVPTMLTMKVFGPEDIERMKTCRYLHVNKDDDLLND